MTRLVGEISEVSDLASPFPTRARFAIEKKVEVVGGKDNGGSLTSPTSPTSPTHPARSEPAPIYCIEPQCYRPAVVGVRCVPCSAKRAALASRLKPRAWQGRRPRRW